jgi:4-amino-4-deoxy-L-arabinose transferase-like glycosyltransferase
MPDLLRVRPVFRYSLLALCLVLFAARLFTLTADFPAGVDWSESLYTDEGWYAGGAITHYLTGFWLVPGDLNTIINFPVLQLVDSGYFSLFSLSLASTRFLTVLFTAGLILLSYLITRKLASETAALICTGLLSLNFFLFGFSKLAILEIPMLTLLLLAMWWAIRSSKTNLWQAIILAILFTLALLTKASASFGLPVLLLLIWQKPGRFRSRAWGSLAFLAGVGLMYGGYLLWALHNYPQDYLSYNEYSLAPRITWSVSYLFTTAARIVWNGKVIDPLMYFLSIGLAPCGLLLFRRYRANPLVQACILWLTVYSLILMVRGYLPPRYYLLFMVPVTMLFSILVTMGTRDLQTGGTGRLSNLLNRVAAALVKFPPVLKRFLPVVLVAAVGLFNLAQVARYLSAPNFTYINMVYDIQQRIRASGEARPVLLGAIAQTMSIELHIPTVNSQYGTQDLLWKLDQYHPNFYVALGPEDKVRTQISQRYNLELLATYNVLGNYYAGKPVYFYRLSPIP